MTNTISLINGDCFIELDNLIQKGIQFDAIIIDPPYEIGYTKWDKALDWKILSKQFYTLLKPTGNLIIFQGWSNVTNTISSINNFTLKNWIIYDRIKGRGAKTNLVSTREDILWYVKSQHYTFNKEPSTIRKKTGGLGLKNGNIYRALSNVWSDISPIVPWSKEKEAHPTQKPIQLMERCIKIWTNENDLVLDCFMGSGSTGVACVNMNRGFIGIEIDKDYFNISTRRIYGREK